MSVKPRTIDNLGIDSSVRYAKDLEQLDRRLVEESKWIPEKTTISVLRPYAPSEFDYFQGTAKTLWALFQPPAEYYNRVGQFFSYQLIPSLGSYEKQETDTDKLASLEDVLSKPHSSKKGKRDSSDNEKEQEDQEKERRILMNLMETLTRLDKTLSLINSRRNQYQKG